MPTPDIRVFSFSGAELDTFTKLFWHGDQEDGDLPSKAGMEGLINKGLAKKDYAVEPPNRLSTMGLLVAMDHFREEYFRLKEAVKENRETFAKIAEGWPCEAAGDKYQTCGNGTFWDAGTDYDQGRIDAARDIRHSPLKKAVGGDKNA